MGIASIWQNLALVIASIPQSGLLMATVGAVLLGAAGMMLARTLPYAARTMRHVGTLVLVGILLLVILQMSRFDPRVSLAVPEIGMPAQVVQGGETRVPMAPDGHFWVRAEVNGVPAAFLVDTGATLTTLNPDTAGAARLVPRRGGIPILVDTANGTTTAKIATLKSLRFGNVAAKDLDVAIVPNLGPTNVLGMNLLSRLGSWRVEGQTMILVPGAALADQPAGN